MPEGPEVRRMAEGLARRIEGRDLVCAEVLGGKWLKKEPTGISVITEALKSGPIRVDSVNVKGKAIYVKIGDIFMWNTLGMGGGWRDIRGKHSHFSLSFSDGREVFFEDIRRFGNISFYMGRGEIDQKLNQIGPDMLNEHVTFETFSERMLKRPNKNICQLLMDQKVISGVGNYIKSEALYRAGVNPHSTPSELNRDKMKSLYTWIRTIIRTSYDQGGATIATYTDMDNNKGNYVFSFHVYRKETDPLGNKVVHEITPDGRMTHWVPSLQK